MCPQHLHVYPGKGFLIALAEHKIDQLQQGCPRGRHVGEGGCIQYAPYTIGLLLGGHNSRARQHRFRTVGGIEFRGQGDELKHTTAANRPIPVQISRGEKESWRSNRPAMKGTNQSMLPKLHRGTRAERHTRGR